MLVTTHFHFLSINLIYIVPLHWFYIVSEVLYNIHLCKAFQCFIPLWEGAITSWINSLGSYTWQLCPHFCFSVTTWWNARCFCSSLIALPTILQSGVEVWWLGMFQLSIHVFYVHQSHRCDSTQPGLGTTWWNARCFCSSLIALPTISTIRCRSVVGWACSNCPYMSFMCINHIDVIAHSLALGALLLSKLPSCKLQMVANFQGLVRFEPETLSSAREHLNHSAKQDFVFSLLA